MLHATMSDLERFEPTVQPPLIPERDIHLKLLGTFELKIGTVRCDLAEMPKRMLALLGIRARPLSRTVIATMLWPEAPLVHSQGSLRSLIGRLDPRIKRGLHISGVELSLSDAVGTDLEEARALAHRLLDRPLSLASADLGSDAVSQLTAELLPDWHDEWLVTDSEQWHECRVRALEGIANELMLRGDFSSAVGAALSAIAAEPLRETSHLALIQTHLAEGNQAAAFAAFERYRVALQRELHIAPTVMMRDLASPLRRSPKDGASVSKQARLAVAGEETSALEVVASGISMEPSIRHGDKLMMSEDVALAAGRIVVAIHEGAWIVKRLAKRDNVFVLRSDNANEEVPLADVEIQGIVVELRRTV